MSSTPFRLVVSVVLTAAVVATSTGCAAHRTAPIAHPDPWQGALGVVTGREVEVVPFTGGRVSGRLVEVTVDGLSIETGPTTEHRARTAVRRVNLLERGRDPLRNGLLIGMGVGIGYALSVLAYFAKSDDGPPTWDGVAMVGLAGGIGAGVGAMVDGLHQGMSRRTIYEAPRSRP